MLIVLTNNTRPIRERFGIGATNNPELRQKLITDLIQKKFIKCQIIFDSKMISNDWIKNVHDPEYLQFLENAYKNVCDVNDEHWIDLSGGLVPNHFYKTKPNKLVPLYKLSGYYGSDVMSPIYEDTFQNSMISAQQAYIAAEMVYNDNSTNIIYVLACSPGHHAKSKEYGGYCYINNAVVAGYRLIELGKKKVGILDIDTHAGNGTAELVHTNQKFQNKLCACSIHCDPSVEFPSFDGFDDDYKNPNIKNIIMKPKSNINDYVQALNIACDYLKRHHIETLIIAFGADTYKDDPDTSPLAKLNIDVDDYCVMAKIIKAHFPEISIIITQEGGYNLDFVPEIVCSFLKNLF